MRQSLTYALVAAFVGLSGCTDNATMLAPTDSRPNWNWHVSPATGGFQPILVCSPTTVAFNGTVSCSFANGGPLNSPIWRFEAVNGVTVSGPSLSGGWSGPMVISGDVVVDYVDNNGNPATLRQGITVNRRAWSWVPFVGGRQGTPGEIDSCLSPAWSGLTSSAYCTITTNGDLFYPRPANLSNGNGYSAATVAGSGPNGGLWYVATTSAIMDLRTQVHRDFRADGPTWVMTGSQTVTTGCAVAFPSNPTGPRTIHTVNTTCVPTPDFTAYVTCVWSHEGQHLRADTAAARTAANDVYALWEPMVAQTSSGLQSTVASAYSLANGRVFNAGAATENTGTQYQRIFWYTTGNGWNSYNFTTPHC
jgi:hypothetical protein